MQDFTLDDRVALHELAARYGNAIDARDWARLATVFTEDCRYELANFGRLDVVIRSSSDLCRYMQEGADHPLAHHVTNVEIDATGDPVRMFSLVLGSLPGGACGSAQYEDVVVRTPQGWRIADRTVTLRR